MKTRTITLFITLLLTGAVTGSHHVYATPPPPPPPNPSQSIHEQHMQIHLQHHYEAHRQAIEMSNSAHENAKRNHEAFNQRLSGSSSSRHKANMVSYGLVELPRRFHVGDMYYASSFKGLQSFMTDLKADNPMLHEVMEPAYRDIKRKRNATVATWATGAGIGTAMIVGGFTFLTNNERVFSGDPFDGHNPLKPNVGIIAGGAGVLLASGIIGVIIQPRQEDIYQFVNLHNRNNADKKLDWEIGMDIYRDNTPGLKLTLNF